VNRNKKAELLVAHLDNADQSDANNDNNTMPLTAAVGSEALRAARRHRMAVRVHSTDHLRSRRS
jgi:hypothetical protein